METLFLSFKKWLVGHRLFITLVLTFCFIAFIIAVRQPFTLKAASYSLLREAAKIGIYLKTWNWNRLEGKNFVLRYEEQDAEVAELVLQTAEEVFKPINETLAYTPAEKVLIIMYPDKASLNKSFGWDADENAMGVYWAGAIRILSPLAWLDKDESLIEEFKEQGPIAHEYTHLVVDYLTKGNYTRWLTEGVAQYMEREITGFAFAGQNITRKDHLYSFEEMTENFDNLSDQSLAYYQSLAAIDYYVENFGLDSLVRFLHDLGKGNSLEQALIKNTGLNLAGFEAQVQDYIVNNSK